MGLFPRPAPWSENTLAGSAYREQRPACDAVAAPTSDQHLAGLSKRLLPRRTAGSVRALLVNSSHHVRSPRPVAITLKTRHADLASNLGATAGVAATPWLFPSSRPGRHLGPNFIMTRLRNLGINLLAARNTALQSLVVEAPPPLVAELLGYSYNTTQRHAEIAAQPWARYVTKTAAESN